MENLPTALDLKDFKTIAGLVIGAVAVIWGIRKAIGLLSR